MNDLELGLTDDEITEWKKFADTNQNGSICWNEFQPMAASLIEKHFTEHPAESGDEWKEGADMVGHHYRVNLITGAQEWLEAKETTLGPHLQHMHQVIKWPSFALKLAPTTGSLCALLPVQHLC